MKRSKLNGVSEDGIRYDHGRAPSPGLSADILGSDTSFESGSKRSVNLSVNAALVREAKALGLNLSDTLGQALAAAVAIERARRWSVENADALGSFDRFFQEHGSLTDHLAAEYG